MAKEITSFEQALQLAGTEKEKAFFSNTELHKHLDADDVQYKELKVIVRALNTDSKTGKVWTPNWHNTSEWKWLPVFWVKASEDKPAGFGFSVSDSRYGHSHARVGSRLLLKDEKTCDHFREHFGEKYKGYYLFE